IISKSNYCHDAREDLSRAEQHSDLNTDNELHGMQIDHSGRKTSSRVRRPRECYSPLLSKRFHSAIVGAVTEKEDSSFSDSEEDEQLPSLPASLLRGNCVDGPSSNSTTGPASVQNYSITGPSSAHNYPGAGKSSVQNYSTAGPSPLHHYPTPGLSPVHHYSTAGPTSLQDYPTAGSS
ncbi:Uncharacterized protein APZ42_000321, partial [Daphnia magna]